MERESARESEGERVRGGVGAEGEGAQRTEEGKEIRTHLALHLAGERECEGEGRRDGEVMVKEK